MDEQELEHCHQELLRIRIAFACGQMSAQEVKRAVGELLKELATGTCLEALLPPELRLPDPNHIDI